MGGDVGDALRLRHAIPMLMTSVAAGGAAEKEGRFLGEVG
jgi:hypothetical protein